MINYLKKLANQHKEVHFTSYLSSEFTTKAVINPPERKLAKNTSVSVLYCNLSDFKTALLDDDCQKKSCHLK